jgi:hypothetical protein
MDIIPGVLDYTWEFVSISRRLHGFAMRMPIGNLWLVLNKAESSVMSTVEQQVLQRRRNARSATAFRAQNVCCAAWQNPGYAGSGLSPQECMPSDKQTTDGNQHSTRS